MTIFDSIALISKSSKSGLTSGNTTSKLNGITVGGNNVSSVNCGGCGGYTNNEPSLYGGNCGCN